MSKIKLAFKLIFCCLFIGNLYWGFINVLNKPIKIFGYVIMTVVGAVFVTEIIRKDIVPLFKKHK